MSPALAVAVDVVGAAAGGGAAVSLRLVVCSALEQPINKRADTTKAIKRISVEFFMAVGNLSGSIGKDEKAWASYTSDAYSRKENGPVKALPFSSYLRSAGRALLGPQASSPAPVALKFLIGEIGGEDACGPRRARLQFEGSY